MKNKIRFEQHGYDFQLQAYEKKLELEKVIATELKAKIGIDFQVNDFFPDPDIKLLI